MEPQLCVLFHSKYSANSKKILEKLQNAPVNIASIYNLNPVCIDNENIRERILSSGDIQVGYVPCILSIYPDGGVEKYEGMAAFNWIDEKIRKHAPPPPPVIQRPPPQPSPPMQVEDYEEEEEEEEEAPRPRKQKPRRPKPKSTQDTDILDLSSEDEDDEEQQEKWVPQSLKKPTVGIRDGPNNYNLSGDFGNIEEPNRHVTQGVRPSGGDTAIDRKKEDLMSTAMAMAKAREIQDESSRPSGMPVNKSPK